MPSRLLPPGMPSPPSFRKANPADYPIVFLSLVSPTLPLYTLNDYAQNIIAQRISAINGVAQVTVLGAQTYAVHVQLDPNAMASRNIGIDEVQDAIAKGNVNQYTTNVVDGLWIRPDQGMAFWDVTPSSPASITAGATTATAGGA